MLVDVAEEIQTFKDFLRMCRDEAGLATWQDVATKCSLQLRTVMRYLDVNPERPRGELALRNRFAQALNRADWSGMVQEWRNKNGFGRATKPKDESIKVAPEVAQRFREFQDELDEGASKALARLLDILNEHKKKSNENSEE